MCSSIPSFTCEVPCGPVLQSCWLGLQNAYLLPQPWDSSFSCWGKWVKLIGSRRCVLSAGDLGHRFHIICSGLLTSSPPFMALPLHEGHCIQNEASCFTSPSWNPVSLLSSFVGLRKVYLPHQDIRPPYMRDIQMDILPYTQPSFVGVGGSPISFPIQGNEPL